MRESVILALTLLVLTTSGCGREIVVSDDIRASQFDVIRGDINQVRASAKRGALRCNVQDECEPALTLISTVAVSPEHEFGVGRCTGFLISPNQVLTNDHCLSNIHGLALSKTHVPCKELLFVHFVDSTGQPGQTIGCKEISVRSGETGIASLDYAVIELEEAVKDRKPLTLSKRGFQDKEMAQVFRVMMSTDFEGVPGGVQNHTECQTAYETYLYPQIDSASSSLMTFGECAIMKGNSGSPVLNTDGEVGAIIQGYLVPSESSAQAKVLRENLINGFGQVGIGTSVACMRELNAQSAEACDPVVPIRNVGVLDYLKANNEFDSSLLPALPGDFTWVLDQKSSNDLRKMYFSRPECTNETSFEAQVAQFRLGLNTQFKAQWVKNPNAEKVSFTRKESLNPLTYNFQSYLGALPIQFCAE